MTLKTIDQLTLHGRFGPCYRTSARVGPGDDAAGPGSSIHRRRSRETGTDPTERRETMMRPSHLCGAGTFGALLILASLLVFAQAPPAPPSGVYDGPKHIS